MTSTKVLSLLHQGATLKSYFVTIKKQPPTDQYQPNEEWVVDQSGNPFPVEVEQWDKTILTYCKQDYAIEYPALSYLAVRGEIEKASEERSETEKAWFRMVEYRLTERGRKVA